MAPHAYGGIVGEFDPTPLIAAYISENGITQNRVIRERSALFALTGTGPRGAQRLDHRGHELKLDPD